MPIQVVVGSRRHARLERVGAVIAGLIDPKATEYRGVTMRSRLEADFARHLDRMGVAWVYEPRIFGPKGRGYLPDFQLVRDGRPCYIEVKPTLAQVPAAKRRMAVIWRSEPDALLIVACAESCRFFESLRDSGWRTFVERWPHATGSES
jgi:hypothetical protein